MRTHTWKSVVAPAAPLLVLLAGCVSDQAPRAQSTPDSARPNDVVLVVPSFEDTDGNHYRDRTRLVAYIYAESTRYPISMKADGEFEFKLENGAGKTLATWHFDRYQTREAMRKLAPGPAYVFDLSLLDVGTDRLADTEADLLATFTPFKGDPIPRSEERRVGKECRSR